MEGWQNGYCTSLENWRPQGLGGSNPSPSVNSIGAHFELIVAKMTSGPRVSAGRLLFWNDRAIA
jgi:hypothetical protein